MSQFHLAPGGDSTRFLQPVRLSVARWNNTLSSHVLPSIATAPSDIVVDIRPGASHTTSGDANEAASSPELGTSSAPSTSSASVVLPPDDDDAETPSASSTSSASIALPPHVESDDVTASTEMTVLTSAERAATVIKASQIALNTKLAVFTFIGTSDSRTHHSPLSNHFLFLSCTI